MALVVGTDTFITLEGADAYFVANYLSTSAELAAWSALSTADKEVLLRKACQSLNRMPLGGIRASQLQTLEFPRAYLATTYTTPPTGYNWLGADYVVQVSVPEAVLQAQAEEALALAVGVPERLQLRKQGVRSFRLGNLSETYSGGAGLTGLVSEVAYGLLRPFLAGGFPVC